MMKKKSVAALFTAACLAAGSLAGCSGASSTASSEAADNTEASDAAQSADNTASDDDTKDLEDVTVILDYVANTNHTGMYVALDQGYYKDAGLNVSIVEPTEGATATLVAVGKGDFGISYQEDVTIALTSADPLPIKAIAAILQHNTSGFATYEGKGINSPKDFEGKTYAGWGGPGEEAVLKAVMTQDGADFSKLNRDLDSRLDYYTPVIIANNDTLENKPEMVKKFLAATEKGYEYAIENPDESAEILLKYTPDSSPELLQKSQEYLADKYMEDTDQWGVMKDEVWDNYTDFMVEYGVIDKAIPAADCYTNEFLPEK